MKPVSAVVIGCRAAQHTRCKQLVRLFIWAHFAEEFADQVKHGLSHLVINIHYFRRSK